MEYFFILGRNPQLSIAEIMSYIEKESLTPLKNSVVENSLLLEINEKLDLQRMIKELGGTIAIGQVSTKGKKKDIENFLEKNEIYFGEEIKFNYSVMNFADQETFDEILQDIKDKFKKERLKAFYRSTIGIIDIQEKGYTAGTPKKIKSKDVVYFLTRAEQYYFGEIKAVYDSVETEKRDIEKPVRRQELAISPRLAKILINLSQTKKGETLLDPFCGVGTVIQEAILQDINAVGIDDDKFATIGCEKNLNWLKTKYKINAKYQIINHDSRKARVPAVDGIATEPSLGEILKVVPTENRAQMMLGGFQNLMIAVINNIKPSLKQGQKIAFTSPLIKTHHQRFGCDINKILSNTSLKLSELKFYKSIKFPIAEMRKDSIVGREFFVVEKL
jgi:tRNA G10  N-methylase Trm11